MKPTLKETLHLDLLRHNELLGKSLESGVKFWLGILSPRFLPVFLFRLSYQMNASGFSIGAKIFSMINVLMFGIEIATSCSIGPGLFFPHTHGTVLGAISIGKNATIYQGVTLGAKDLDFTFDKTRRPIVGDGVLIGAGAKVLGGIEIGNNVKIGANSVVLISVPSNSVATGVPAKILNAKEV